MDRRRVLWTLLAAVLGIGAAVVLADAVRDLAADPSFAALLRLVVEAVAAAVVIAAAWSRARPARPAAPTPPPGPAARPAPPGRPGA